MKALTKWMVDRNINTIRPLEEAIVAPWDDGVFERESNSFPIYTDGTLVLWEGEDWDDSFEDYYTRFAFAFIGVKRFVIIDKTLYTNVADPIKLGLPKNLKSLRTNIIDSSEMEDDEVARLFDLDIEDEELFV